MLQMMMLLEGLGNPHRLESGTDNADAPMREMQLSSSGCGCLSAQHATWHAVNARSFALRATSAGPRREATQSHTGATPPDLRPQQARLPATAALRMRGAVGLG